MGHSNIATTMDVYGHLMPNTDADLASALDTLRSEKLEEGPKLIALDSAYESSDERSSRICSIISATCSSAGGGGFGGANGKVVGGEVFDI